MEIWDWVALQEKLSQIIITDYRKKDIFCVHLSYMKVFGTATLSNE